MIIIIIYGVAMIIIIIYCWRCYYILIGCGICKLANVVEDDTKAPFSITTTPRCKGRHNSILWIAPLILDPYLIM